MNTVVVIQICASSVTDIPNLSTTGYFFLDRLKAVKIILTKTLFFVSGISCVWKIDASNCIKIGKVKNV